LVPWHTHVELTDAALAIKLEERQPATREGVQNLKGFLQLSHEGGVRWVELRRQDVPKTDRRRQQHLVGGFKVWEGGERLKQLRI
jgi:hypothetical protein